MIEIILYIIIFIFILFIGIYILKLYSNIEKLIEDNTKLKRGEVLQELEIRKLKKKLNEIINKINKE